MLALRHFGSGHPADMSMQLIVAVVVLAVIVVSVVRVVGVCVVVVCVVVVCVVVETHAPHMTGQCRFTTLPSGPELHLPGTR